MTDNNEDHDDGIAPLGFEHFTDDQMAAWRESFTPLDHQAAERFRTGAWAGVTLESLDNTIVHHVDCPVDPCECEPIQATEGRNTTP